MHPDPSQARLLTINFGGIGDEVLFLPALAAIRAARPLWHITLLCEPRSCSIAQITNLIDDCVTFDIKKRPLLPGDYLELIGILRRGRYDVVLSSGSSPLVAVLLASSLIPRRIGYDSGPLARLLLSAAVPLLRTQHAALMYHDLVRGLGIESAAAAPAIVVPPGNLASVRAWLDPGGAEAGTAGNITPAFTVLVHPGMSLLALKKGIIKTWAAANWAGLIERLLARGCRVVLSGGPDDQETLAEITGLLAARGFSSHPALVLAGGKTRSLADLCALIALSDLLVCVDSAPMHMAVAVEKPLVALFGPTDPARLLWPDKRYVALVPDGSAALPGSGPAVDISLDRVYECVIAHAARHASPP